MAPDNDSLFRADRARIVIQLEKSLKPETEIPALHDRSIKLLERRYPIVAEPSRAEAA
jgi:hypothetical protein